MDRINGDGHVNHLFVSEDLQIFRRPTEITSKWMNDIQEELASIVLYQDGTLDPDNNAQVLEKIISLIQVVGADHFVNRTDASDDDKWALFPKGHIHPFIPTIMGSELVPWLAAHADWAVLDNSVVDGIEGRVFAIAGTGHAAGSQTGSDNAVVVEHGHDVDEEAHTHASGAFNNILKPPYAGSLTGNDYDGSGTEQAVGAGDSSAMATVKTNISIAAFGVDGMGKNIQPTQYLTYIYKLV